MRYHAQFTHALSLKSDPLLPRSHSSRYPCSHKFYRLLRRFFACFFLTFTEEAGKSGLLGGASPPPPPLLVNSSSSPTGHRSGVAARTTTTRRHVGETLALCWCHCRCRCLRKPSAFFPRFPAAAGWRDRDGDMAQDRDAILLHRCGGQGSSDGSSTSIQRKGA